jgi:hypothetical protein
MSKQPDTVIENDMTFWAGKSENKEDFKEDFKEDCKEDCKEEIPPCNCESRNDVCSKCLDSVLDEQYQEMIKGKAGKNVVDFCIAIKTYLKTCLNPKSDAVKILDIELKALYMLREIQTE